MRLVPWLLLYACVLSVLSVALFPNLPPPNRIVAGGCIGLLVVWGGLWLRDRR